MKVMQEFKQFALRGNALDMAIGVILGAAFGKIVTSLVNDVIMPPIGKITGNVDLSNMFVVLGQGTFPSLAAAKQAGATTLNYGLFINTVADFLIVSFVIFILVKVVSAARRRETEKPSAPAAPSAQEVLLTEIRDILKAK